MTLLALIPARAGSKGIPQKALQLVDGKPLILHTLETVQRSLVADRIVVTTDCPQIKGFCELRGYEVLDRPSHLATDDVPLMPVVRHAVDALDWKGDIAVFQPTCPLLTPDTVQRAVAEFNASNHHWAITGTREPHTYWADGKPLRPRVNRQQMTDPLIRESGAIQIMRLSALEGTTHRGVIEIPAGEALDIDTPADLQQARATLGAKAIRFDVVMSKRQGSGHYWRCLQLADTLAQQGHRIYWCWYGDPAQWAWQTIVQRGWQHGPDSYDLRIFDVLNASESQVLADRAMGVRTLVFEDDGPGAKAADRAINEMVDGPDWCLLRPEFTCLPEYEVKDAGHVLITFGGTDPSGLADRVTRACWATPNRSVSPADQVHMAAEMQAASLVITGQGRTVFEAAACGVPCISIAANAREARHVQIPGVVYLGLHTTVGDHQISETVARLLPDQALRQEMSATARAAVDGRGLERILSRVNGLLEGLRSE